MRFGTDGIRGRADEDITVSLAYRVGRAVAEVFPEYPCFVGFDTRESSPRLAAATLAGLADAGAHGVNLGVMTTPGVAVIAEQRVGVGVVVSASHNPYYDNGLKVLGVGGTKLDVATERRIEEAVDLAVDAPGPFASVPVDQSASGEYLDRLASTLPSGALGSLHVVLDCANGAASHLAPALFRALGASVTVINAEPDGTNVNRECGSTHPEGLAEHVRGSNADLGLAFDGDADRLIAVDSHGVVRDGDDLMILFATDMTERGELHGALVVTQMSNLGLHGAMRNARIPVQETEVGDRAVLKALEEHDGSFGGEQSGHLIFRRLSPTGDGMLTGILLCELVKRRGRLSQLAEAAWRRLPQRMLNIPRDLFDAAVIDEVRREVVDEFSVRDEDYRLLVRPSGTEPVVRVMVEARDDEFVHEFLARVAARSALSA